MFFKSDPIDVIRNGDINKLKKMLEKKRGLVDEGFKWPDGRTNSSTSSGSILHAAAFFNQPEIIKFLVNEKGMDVNQPNEVSQRTPLHYACENDRFESGISPFFQLGADLTLRCREVYNAPAGTPYEVSKDERIKELLLPAHEERLRQQAAAKAEGTWTPQLPAEVTHQYERQLPQGEFLFTDIFNFSARRLVSIAKDLQDGQLAKETHYFDDMRDKQILHEACAKLNELGGHIDPACIEKRIASNAQQPEEAKPSTPLRLRP